MKMVIDYLKEEDFEKTVENAMKEAIKSLKETNEDQTINIKNIISSKFCDIFMIEAEEFNGWQCDWWSKIRFEGYEFQVIGGAWYGTIELLLEA